jgi:hypothetical protein
MIYFTDGFRNRKASGYTVTDHTGKVIAHLSEPPYRYTNNESELQGIIFAATVAEEGSEIITDSKVCMAWIRRGAASARPDLDRLIDALKGVIGAKGLKVYWRPREENLAGKWNEVR